MSKRIFITGIGTISSIGKDSKTALSSLRSNQSGVGNIQYIATNHKGKLPLCEVKYSNEELCDLAGVDRTKSITRSSLLGIIATKEAWEMAGTPPLNDGRTLVLSSNSVGGMDKTEQFFSDFLKNKYENAKVLHTHQCADSTEQIAEALGASGMVSTISTACSSAANAIMVGARMLKYGLADRAVVGGVDALTKFTINGFNTLQILDAQKCQPFDQNRRGLNLGEGAGFLFLEPEGIAKEENILGELVGYANSNDAYHQTASSPDGTGAFLAMQGALDIAKLKAEQIDYINVHGTGTQNNDLSEGVAMKRLFGASMPKFSSTKGFTGHTLAAAGGIEAVFSILSLQKQVIFPNLGFQTPMMDLGSNVVPETSLLENQNLRYILSNSFGFGGNASSLIFAKY